MVSKHGSTLRQKVGWKMSEEWRRCPFLCELRDLEIDGTSKVIGYVCKGQCHDCQAHHPNEEALKAENESLKEKLENVKNHLVIHRDHAIQSYRQDGKAYLEMNDFLVRFCNNLLEVINDDTEKG